MSNNQTAKAIIQKLGNKENINDFMHCATRLRFEVKNIDSVDFGALREIDGVIEAQLKNGQVQVIIGPGVYKVYDELQKEIGVLKKVEKHDKEKKSIVDKIVEFISGVFIPVTLSMGGSGVIKGLLPLAVNFGWITDTSDIYLVLNLIADAVFYYLPFMLAYSTAKKINTNRILALTLAGVLMYPTLINGAAEGASALSFIGLKVPMISYSSTVIPIILSVILLKYVFAFFQKILPKNLELVLTSGLTLLVTATISLIMIAPLGTYAGNYISTFFEWLYAVAGPLAGIIYGLAFPLLVITGMGYAMLPLVFQNLQLLGYDYIMLPIMTISNMNQGIANFAVALKTKNKKIRATAIGTGVTASIGGITEPAMYSINLRFKKPFYATLIANAIAGGLSRLLDVKMFTFAGGIVSIPGFSSLDYTNNFMNALLCLAVGVVLTFVITFIWTTQKDFQPIDENSSHLAEKEIEKEVQKGNIEITSVGNGQVIPISETPDKTFSENLIGEGVAIDIRDNYVHAPFDGVVKAIYPTNHAIGLESDQGVEVLIHIGIDTVSLENIGFKRLVEDGQNVKKGQKLLEFDYEKLLEQEVYTPTMVIITNSQDIKKINVTTKKEVTINDSLFVIEN
ncbi:glucose PTS transporter subunit IIA [Enterococcus hulanensis]|uniref:glucose PTS transporter subunit IIA n=1 Tax=Enterococcus hulanensis TaxID=2559929 RepID=UPI00288E97AB|nr:glucose PTS transporter subunit IIA [Enterococcus hulanensis]MDT2661691.1 glucose PTS transporter subunit IIA [Enterococcus hulanensis]